MKLKELKQIIDEILLEDPSKVEAVVAIPVIEKDHLGGRAYVNVISIGLGYDWESGRLNLETEYRLVRELKRS